MIKIVLKKLGEKLKVRRMDKFVNRTFDMIHYVVGTIIGVIAITRRPYGKCFAWAKDCKDHFWQIPEGFVLTYFEKIYYFLFLAYYTVDIGFVFTTSEPIMMIIHHIVTISEVINCVVLQSPVVGLSIMILHDITDTPLYLGKFFVYLGSKLKDFTLVLFAISCTWFRIFNYPIIVYHVYQVGKDKNKTIHYNIYMVEWLLLCVLYCLHLIWEGKIIANIIDIVKGGDVHDSRSDEAIARDAEEAKKELKKDE